MIGPHLSPRDVADLQSSLGPGWVMVTDSDAKPYGQTLLDGRHAAAADEPTAVGGADSGPSPYELLLMALGACTAMTLRMYAARKQIALDRVIVRLKHDKRHRQDCLDCDDREAMLDHVERHIELFGDLGPEQRARLLEIADKCPVHRTLQSRVEIRTVLVA